MVRWAQRHPVEILHKRMTPTGWLGVQQDAGFKRDDEDVDAPTGKSMRGANFMRLGHDPTGKETCHVLDWHCGSIKAVTRSTFVSELQAAISATDSALMVGLTLHEIKEGPVSPRTGMRLRDDGGSSTSIHVCIDAMSIFSTLRGSCEAANVKRSVRDDGGYELARLLVSFASASSLYRMKTKSSCDEYV